MCFSKDSPPPLTPGYGMDASAQGLGSWSRGQSSVAEKAFKGTHQRGRDKTLEADPSRESKVHGSVPQWSGGSEAPKDLGTLICPAPGLTGDAVVILGHESLQDATVPTDCGEILTPAIPVWSPRSPHFQVSQSIQLWKDWPWEFLGNNGRGGQNGGTPSSHQPSRKEQ